jgi:erythromycin esterase
MLDAAAWVRANAIPLATVEAGNGFADLEPLRKVIGDARVVSLGEATHGTREFFQLKHRLLEFCVAELGFTIFGIEASYPECLRVNDYVLHGRGNAAEALSGTRFWTWDTEEVLALIEWMRGWNRTHARQVKFYGFDMQFPAEATLTVLDYLERVAPELAAGSAAALWPLSNDLTAHRFAWLPEATRATALAAIGRLGETFAGERAAWVGATGTLAWQLARLSLVVLGQSARLQLAMADPLAPPMSPRDVPMADNVAALLEAEGPEAKAVLWAHNGHVERESRFLTHDKQPDANMGTRLDELLGRQHVVVGFAFNQGSFQARGQDGALVSHAVGPAPEGSLDRVLAAAEVPLFLLPMTTAPASGPVADWLGTRPLSRCIGSAYLADHAGEYLAATDPRRSFDVLAFVETTTAARPTEAGRRPSVPQPRQAPAPANLELAGSGEVPDGWTWSGDRYRIAPSAEPTPAGGRSISITRTSAPWRWGQGALEQTFSAGP